MVKKLLWVGGILCLPVILAGLTLYFAFDSQQLGRALLTRVGEATGVELEAESIRLGLLRGMELTGVSGSGKHETGEYRVSLARLRFQHRPASLLSGDLVVERILLEEPRVELLALEGTPATEREIDAESPAPRELPGLRLEIREISVRNGFIRARERGLDGTVRENLRLEGLDLTLRELVFDPAASAPVQRFSGRGEIGIAEVLAGKLPLRDVEGGAVFSRGILDGSDLVLTTDYGDLQADIRVDFNPAPFTYEMTAAGEPLNVNRMVGMGEREDLGPGRLLLQARGTGSDPGDLEGEGTLHLAPGTVPEHPVLARAGGVLGLSGLAGGPYTGSEASFRIAEKRVTLEGFSLSTPQMGLSLDGWADLDGPIQFDLGMRVAREGVTLERFPAPVLDALTDGEGWILIPLKVAGTREEPSVTPDAEALLSRAGRGFLRRFGGPTF